LIYFAGQILVEAIPYDGPPRGPDFFTGRCFPQKPSKVKPLKELELFAGLSEITALELKF